MYEQKYEGWVDGGDCLLGSLLPLSVRLANCRPREQPAWAESGHFSRGAAGILLTFAIRICFS